LARAPAACRGCCSTGGASLSAISRAWRVLRRRGLRVAVQKLLRRLFPLIHEPDSMVPRDLVLEVDWREPHRWEVAPRSLPQDGRVVAWVMSPPGANSGGHQNIFRFIRVLEDAGCTCRVYLTSTT